MKKTVLFFFFLVMLSACADKKPANLLPQSQMTDLLYEMVLIGAIESSSYQKDTIYVVQTPEALLQKYNLDSLSFAEQHRYYLKNQPQIYADMFDSIQHRYQRKVEELGGVKSPIENTKKNLMKSLVDQDSVVEKSEK